MPIIPENRSRGAREEAAAGGISPALPADPAQRYEAARDNGVRNQARLLMQDALTAHGNFRKENADEETWEADLTDRESGVREALGMERMTPEMKAELNEEFSGWQRRNAEAVKADATRNGFARARQRTTDLIEAYGRAGDFASAAAILEQAKGREFTEAEAGGRLAELTRSAELHAAKGADEQVRGEIDLDPGAWLDRHSASPPPDGEDVAVNLTRRRYAMELQGRRQVEMQDVVGAGIASGKIRSAVEIEHYAEDALPVVKEFFKAELVARNDPAEQARRRTRVYQDRTAGEIAAGLLELKPEGLEERLLLDARIGTLPEGPVKERLRADLRAKSSDGAAEEDDSALSRSLGAAAEMFRNNSLGMRRPLGATGETSEAVQGYGKITREMIRWAAANPQAGEEDVQRKLAETTKPVLAEVWKRRVFGTDPDYFDF